MAERSSHAGVQKGAKNLPSAQNGRGSESPRPGLHDDRSNRLPKTRVLRGYESFSRVLSGGRSLSVPPIRLFLRSHAGPAAHAVVGFAVARSFRSAAKRNRVRRLMREAYRRNQALWDAEKDVEAVWMYVGSPRDTPRYDRIEKSVCKLMKKASEKSV